MYWKCWLSAILVHLILHIWKANFSSKSGGNNTKHKMAEFEGIFGRHFQSPNVRSQL